MSRAIKKLDEAYAKEKRKTVLLIGFPVVFVVMLIMLNIPLNVSRYHGRVSEIPYLASDSLFGMVIRVIRVVDGRGGAGLNRARFNCKVELNGGEPIIAKCPFDLKQNEKVIVVKMQTIFDFIVNRRVYTASKKASDIGFQP